MPRGSGFRASACLGLFQIAGFFKSEAVALLCLASALLKKLSARVGGQGKVASVF